MHMAAAWTTADADAWLAEHSAYCRRLCALITLETCRGQQEKSSSSTSGDLRCSGCNGLHDQPSASDLFSPDIARNACETSEDAEGNDIDLSGLVLDISPEITHRIMEQDPELARELLALMANDDEPEGATLKAVRHRSRKDQTRRVAVYNGRCGRCGGYMVNAMERHDGIKDDEVYRCYSCGWRTSPGYEWNRRIDR